MSRINNQPDSHRLCVAPMLDWTDRFCRYFLRQVSRRTRLYTEMLTTGALLHGDCQRFLRFDPAEHPVALQLGGSDADALAASARLGAQAGYDEINLNLGCPSDRVQSGRFGACLMKEPEHVATLVGAMIEAVSVPVTVKHRLGVDDQDSYDALSRFVAALAEAGCQVFIVHARKAWLSGLSPKQNRDVPPLRYQMVHRLKRDFPRCRFIINGGFHTLAQASQQLDLLDGVMIGREAYRNPWLLADADRLLFGDPAPRRSRHALVTAMLPFVETSLQEGARLQQITRHMLGLYQGQPGARAWRRHLSEHAHRPGAGTEVLLDALAKVGAQDRPQRAAG